MQRNSTPLAWYPKGVSDTLDASEVFTGAMVSLSNLIPDPSTPNLWQCRPAAVEIGSMPSMGGGFSSGFSSGFLIGLTPGAGEISCMRIVGSFLYGLVRANATPGFDYPFCFNLASNTFVLVTGITAFNVPASLPTIGAWVPPTMDVIGSKVVVTHFGFGATANFFGWFDISVPGAPVWSAGNVSGAIMFSTVPTFVAQFSGRAYFIVNTASQPAVVFTDPLNPLVVTNATQVLTFGDNVTLTALGQLRLYNQLGGIVQSLIVFKGVANMYQVTGDSALGTLAVNALNVATGTLCPLGICSTSKGLAFISPDGMRLIDFTANVSDPIGTDGQGVTLPFVYTQVPSRVIMAASGDVVRISTFNGQANNAAQEWWYDIPRKCWSGPHTFPANMIQPYQNTFIVAPIGVPSSLWQSDTEQSLSSTYTENGVALSWVFQTSFLPDTRKMVMCAMSQALLHCALSSGAAPIQIIAIDPNNTIFDTVNLSVSGGTSIWGAFQWGAGVWGASGSALDPRQLQWHVPIVFAKLSIRATGGSNADVKLGSLHMRYKILRYLTDLGAVA